jgi:hypothetical protein
MSFYYLLDYKIFFKLLLFYFETSPDAPKNTVTQNIFTPSFLTRWLKILEITFPCFLNWQIWTFPSVIPFKDAVYFHESKSFEKLKHLRKLSRLQYYNIPLLTPFSY